MSDDLVLLIGNTMDFDLVGHKVGNQPIVDAVVTLRLETVEGDTVAGQAWPMTMEHLTGAVYRAELPASIEVQDGQRLYAVVASDGGSLAGPQKWRTPVIARYRR